MLVRATAPVRIADAGGWTDTWFARHGAVCCLAVTPGVEVAVEARPRPRHDGPTRVVLDARAYGERYAFVPGAPGGAPGRHPLLEAAVEEAGVPDGSDLEITVTSGVPPGCSTGTSAAVTVALLAALDALTPGRRTPAELAAAAHRVETERLGQQSGVQDQLVAAHGGACFIRVDPYPRATVTPIDLPPAFAEELDRRLLLVYLGTSHRSSAVHEQVIAGLAGRAGSSPQLDALRRAAEAARDALAAGDVAAYGRALVTNTDAQAALHPALVGPAATTAIEVARAHGAAGWKVNGAGGDGGSLTVLGPADLEQRDRLRAALVEADPALQPIDVRLSATGVTVTAA